MKLLNITTLWCLFFTVQPIYSRDYTIFAIGDSSIQFTFNTDYDNLKPNWTKDFTTRTILLPNSLYASLTCFMHNLSGKTLHGLQKINLETLINQEHIDSLDAILLSFGLVDVIWHIKPQSLKQNKSIEEIIEELTIPYIQNVLNIKRAFPHYKGHLIIMATTPPVYSEAPLTSGERRAISRALNASLKHHTSINNIPYFDPYESCINEEGSLKEEYDSLDGVHFSLKTNQVLIDSFYYFLETLL